MSEKYECYYCNEEIVGSFWANYYTYEYDKENPGVQIKVYDKSERFFK